MPTRGEPSGTIARMDLTPEERAKYAADWQKANAAGARLGRQRAVATVVSSLVFAMVLIPFVFRFGLLGIVFGMVVGVPAGMAVRRKLEPKGQFR